MKLGEGEERIAEYYFKGPNDVANVSVLTNRRLVVVYRNAEESYPLSKIIAVKIIFNRSWGLLIVGAIIALIGIIGLLSGNGEGGNVVGGNVVVGIVFFGYRCRFGLSWLEG